MEISLIAFIPALIWAIAPLLYKDFLVNNSVIKVNFCRMLFASLFLLFPFFLFGYNEGIFYGILSGLLTLVVGDSFYLLSIRKIGASIAAPVAYTYVFFSQIAAIFLGEEITYTYFVSSILILIGIFILSRGNKKEFRILGIIVALGASLFWTLGQAMIKLATIQNMNPMSIAFARTFSACLILALICLIKDKSLKMRTTKNKQLLLASISIYDLALGSSLFILAIALAGLGITIILTSSSPLMTQLIAKFSGKESPTVKDIIGGSLIIFALIISLIY